MSAYAYKYRPLILRLSKDAEHKLTHPELLARPPKKKRKLGNASTLEISDDKDVVFAQDPSTSKQNGEPIQQVKRSLSAGERTGSSQIPIEIEAGLSDSGEEQGPNGKLNSPIFTRLN